MNERVLLADDEKDLLETVSYALRREGFEVECVEDGEAALAAGRSEAYDLMVLDVMMPKLSGIDVCRTLRSESDLPILMLTAKDAELDLVLGLGLGADDYVTKPFAFAELVARVHALCRRARRALPPVLDRAGVELDPVKRYAARDGRPLVLSPKEFAVLEVLIRADTVVSTEELLEKAWDEHADPFTNAVRMAVMTLRKKLGPPSLIHTVTGAGYRFGS